VVAGFDGAALDEHREDLEADPEVTALGVMATGLVKIDGEDTNIHAFESLKGDAGPTLLAGRLPSGPDEVALGSGTLRAADLRIGDQATIDGQATTLELEVVGRVAFPVIDDRSSVERGVAVTREALDRIASLDEVNIDFVVTFADGVDLVDASHALEEQLDSEVFPARTPAEVANLREVEALPRVLAGFLAALALVAAVHALMTTTRRRQRDLAVLRTVGFDRRQLTATLAWQSLTIILVGLVVGVPLGIVGGRLTWRQVARGMGVVEDPTTPVALVLAFAALAVLVGGLSALLPARRAHRIVAAGALRAS
jgi:hypothetical protein